MACTTILCTRRIWRSYRKYYFCIKGPWIVGCFKMVATKALIRYPTPLNNQIIIKNTNSVGFPIL